MKLQVSALAVALLAPVWSAASPSAQPSAMPRASTPRTIVAASAQRTQHRFFGLLQSVNGQMLTLQLRGGRVLVVNASQAFVDKLVSEPLFRGKPTVVQGVFGAGGVFFAAAVKRGAPLAVNWGLDH